MGVHCCIVPLILFKPLLKTHLFQRFSNFFMSGTGNRRRREVWVPTVGRAAAAGRPKVRSAVGRPGGSGGGRHLPRMGVRGVTPKEILKFYIKK